MKRFKRFAALLLAILMLTPPTGAYAQTEAPAEEPSTLEETVPQEPSAPPVDQPSTPPAEEPSAPPTEEPVETTAPTEEPVESAAPTEEPVPVAVASVSVTAEGGAATLSVGESLQLAALVLPEDAADKTLTWSVSDGLIATVDANGLVTALTAGTVTVTATSPNGVFGAIDLSVTELTLAQLLAQGGEITYEDELTLTEDMTVPAGAVLTLTNKLTVPADMALTVEGELKIAADAEIYGALIIAETGAVTVMTDGDVKVLTAEPVEGVSPAPGSVTNLGKLDVYGAVDFAENCDFSQDSLAPTVYETGALTGSRLCTVEVATYEAGPVNTIALLVAELGAAQSGETVTLTGDIIADSEAAGVDITVPAGITLKLAGFKLVTRGNNFIINGVLDVDANSDFILSNGASLTVSSGARLNLSGTFENLGTLTLDSGSQLEQIYPYGRLYNDGTVNNDSGSTLVYAYVEVSSESDLKAALDDWHVGYVSIVGDITIYDSLNIYGDKEVSLSGSYTLTFSDDWGGSTLTVGGDSYLHLDYGSGFALEANSTVYNFGEVNVEDTVTVTQEGVFYDRGGTVTGGGASAITVTPWKTANASTFDALKKAIEVTKANTVTLTANISIPSGKSLTLSEYTNIVVPAGKTLIVASGGSLRVNPNCEIQLDGGTLSINNNGTATLNGGSIASYGGIINNNGKLLAQYGSVGLYSGFSNGTSIFTSGTGTTGIGTLWTASESEIRLIGGNFTVYDYAELQGTVTATGGKLMIEGSVDCIGQIDVSGSGTLEVWGSLNLNRIDIGTSGGLSFDGGHFRIASSGSVENNGNIVISSTTGVNQDRGGIYHKGDSGVLVDPTGALKDNKAESDDEDDIRSALNNANILKVVVSGDVTLNSSLEVPAGKTLIVNQGVTLNVPVGKALRILYDEDNFSGGTLMNYGGVDVYGTLENAGYVGNGGWFSFANNSYLTLNGRFNNRGLVTLADEIPADHVSQVEPNGLFISEGGSLQQSGDKLIPTVVEVRDAATLAARLGNWQVERVYVVSDITANGELTVPAGKILYINTGATLTTAYDLEVEEDASFSVNGTLDLSGSSPHSFTNYGKTWVGGNITCRGQYDFISNYGYMELNAPDDEVLSLGGLMENWGNLNLTAGTFKVSGADAELLIAEYMEIGSDARLVFQDNSKFSYSSHTDRQRCVKNFGTVSFDGTATVDMEDGGSFINRGTVTNPPDGLIVSGGADVATLAALKTALKKPGMKEINLTKAFAITENITIPAGMQVLMDCGGTFTVNAGRTLTLSQGAELSVGGSFEDTLVTTLLNKGTIVNNGSINIAGKLDNRGSFKSGAESCLSAVNGPEGYGCIDNSGTMQLNSMYLFGDEENGAWFKATGSSKTTVNGKVNLSGFSYMRIQDSSTLSIAGTEEFYAGMYIGEGAEFVLWDSAVFTSNQYSWIENHGLITQASAVPATIGGSFLNKGTIDGDGAAALLAQVNKVNATTSEELAAALDDENITEINIAGNVNVTGEHTVGEDVMVIISGPNTLTVSGSAKLDVNGIIVIDQNYDDPEESGGKLTVASGGTLTLKAGGGIAMNSGTLENNGALITENASGAEDNAWINAEPFDGQQTEIINNGAFTHGGFMALVGSSSFANTAPMTVTGVMMLENSTLSIGSTMNVAGGIVIANGAACTVSVLTGSTLNLTGDARFELAEGTALENSGAISFDGDAVLGLVMNIYPTPTYSGVNVNQLTAIFAAGSEGELRDITADTTYLTWYSREIWLRNSVSSTVTLMENFTLPSNFQMVIADEEDAGTGAYRGTTLAVPQGVTFINEGRLVVLASALPDGSAWEYCSELNVTGNLTNYGNLEVYGKLTLSGSGSYRGLPAQVMLLNGIPGQVSDGVDNYRSDVAATAITVIQEDNFHTLKRPGTDEGSISISFSAKVEPANAGGKDVSWDIVDAQGTHLPLTGVSIEQNGQLTVLNTVPSGVTEFYVQAASVHDSSVKGSYKITMVSDSVNVMNLSYEGETNPDYTQPIVLYSGESIQLCPLYLQGEEPNLELVYSAVGDGSSYADLDFYTGQLSARYVTEEHSFTVKVSREGQVVPGYSEATRTLIIRPRLSGVEIISDWFIGDHDISGTVQTVNVNELTARIRNQESTDVVLRPVSVPWVGDPNVSYNWDVVFSNTEYTYTTNASGHLVISPADETPAPATATVTCTARNSDTQESVSAKTTLKFVYLATGISIVNKKDNSELGMDEDWLTPVLTAGASMELGAKFDELDTIVNSKVSWSLRPEDALYASVSAAGKLSAKATVTTATVVEVTVKALDGGGRVDTRAITILPRATSVSIVDGSGKNVSNGTVYVDFATEGSVPLKALSYPEDARTEYTWTPAGDNAYASITANPDGTVELRPAVPNKAGSFTLTAKAADGSGKSAKVTVKVGSFIKAIAFSQGSLESMEAGETRQLGFTTGPATPTNGACTWSVAPESKAYASITAAGNLTLKTNIYEPMYIKVLLTTKDTGKVFGGSIFVSPANTLVIKKAVNDPSVPVSPPISYNGVTAYLDVGDSLNMEMAKAATNEDALTDQTWTVPRTAALTSSVDPDTNKLTLTGVKAGTVTVTAKAKIGGVANTASFKVVVREPITDIEIVKPSITTQYDTISLNSVASGKKLQLKANVSYASPTESPVWKAGSNLVTWSLDPGDEDYASVSASGLVTAKAGLLVPKVIAVIATAKDGSGIWENSYVHIYPAATAVAVGKMENGSFVNKTGQTLTLDRNDDPNDMDIWQLSARVVPYSDEDGGLAWQDVIWKSSNVKLLTVNGIGLLAPGPNFDKGGTVTITATTADGTGKSASVKVQIVEKVSYLSVNFPAGTPVTLEDVPILAYGKSLKLSPDFYNYRDSNDTNPTNKKVRWFILDGESSATISAAGVLTAKKLSQPSTVLVQCEALDGSTPDSVPLLVYLRPLTSSVALANMETGEVLTGRTITMDVGDTLDLKVSALPTLSVMNGNAENYKIVSNARVVDWDGLSRENGTVRLTAMAPGSSAVTFTATDGSGKSAKLTVKVLKLTDRVKISGPIEVAIGKGVQLKAECTSNGEASTNGKVTWTMDASYKAKFSLSAGKVTAKSTAAAGDKVRVRATAADGSGVYAEYELTVTAPVTAVQLVDLGSDNAIVTGKTLTVDVDDGFNVAAVTQPGGASDQVTWKCSLASADLRVRGNTVYLNTTELRGKTVTLTATAADGSGKSAKVTLKLVQFTDVVNVISPTRALAQGKSVQFSARCIAVSPSSVPSNSAVVWSLSPTNMTDADRANFTLSSAGKLTAKTSAAASSTVTVRATAADGTGRFDEITLTVTVPTTAIAIYNLANADAPVTGTTLNLVRGDNITLAATTLPEGAGIDVTWKCSLSTVQYTANGNRISVTMPGDIAVGTIVTLTATATDGTAKYATVKLKAISGDI